VGLRRHNFITSGWRSWPGFIRPVRQKKLRAHAWQADTLNPQRSEFSKMWTGSDFLCMKGLRRNAEDSNNLCGLIAGYINHPNVRSNCAQPGIANMRRSAFAAGVARENPNFDKPLVMLEQQQSGTEVAMLTEAIQDTFLGP